MSFLPKFLFLLLFAGYVAHAVKDDGGSVGEDVDIIQGGDAAEHQGRHKTTFHTGNNIRIHPIANHDRVGRMHIEHF